MLTFKGTKYNTFKESAEARGLVQSAEWLKECLLEAVQFQMPRSLRRLFASILVFCTPSDINMLWETFYEDLSEDYGKQVNITATSRLNQTLQSIDYYLDSMGKSLTNYKLPEIHLDSSQSTVDGNK